MSDAIAPCPLPHDRMPRHIAIIMDGNGRWAQRRGQPRVEGHRQGAQTVELITRHCAAWGLEQLTLYCLSSENWQRPAAEIELLMDLLRHFLVVQRETLQANNLRLSVIGRREGLPEDVLQRIDETVELTRGNTGMRLCLAINYGGRAELVDATRQLVADIKSGRLPEADIDEAAIAARLYTAGMPDPDLLIRTAGELRVSNYLLWQISYAEIYVTETCWPDFDIAHLTQAVQAYANRQRRFGGLTE